MVLLACMETGSFLSGAEEENETYLIAYAQIQEPRLISIQPESGLPMEISEHPFSIYLLYQTELPSQLQWVVCVSEETDVPWHELAAERAWNSFTLDGFTCFVSEGSLLHKVDPGIARVLAHKKGTPTVAASAGLLSDWNAALRFLYEHDDARIPLFGSLIPSIREHPDAYTSYLPWWVEELTSIDSFYFKIDTLNERDVLTVALRTVPGSRLYKPFKKSKQSESTILSFVPKTASKLLFGQLDAAAATSYLNFFYEATNEVNDETFLRVRSGLNELDFGFFDLWDGSWATWTPQNSEDRMLLLGGRFVS